jgi:fructose-1,6-bisphosphatase/inositol monophosphatase family enzyme
VKDPLRDLPRWLETANAMVDETRRLVLEAVARGFSHRFKADDSFVTDVDLAVERHLRARIAEHFPGHGVIGEELDATGAGAELRWTIDPIDGTHSFRFGVPFYGTLLALLHGDVPVLGVIDMPGLALRVAGARGLGARANGATLTLADADGPVEREIVATGDRAQFEKAGKLSSYERLAREHPVVRTYSDCLGHALALQGRVGAMVDFGLHLWDVAATEAIAREAGARFVCLERRAGAGADARHDVVFGKPAVVDRLLRILT